MWGGAVQEMGPFVLYHSIEDRIGHQKLAFDIYNAAHEKARYSSYFKTAIVRLRVDSAWSGDNENEKT
jgi:hypothetical protein